MKKTTFFVAIAITFTATLSSCKSTRLASNDYDVEVVEVVEEPVRSVKNIILVIGDGMGPAQVTASIVQAQGDNSQFLRFPYSGFSRTHSYDKYTTDSGAGGTAIVTGHKVQNGHIALSPNNRPWPSLFYTLNKEQGLATGFVVTSSVLDATPASTYAHVPDRHMWDRISLQMSQCPHTVMMGGDKEHFLLANRKDDLSPLDTLRLRGYELVYNIDSMVNSTSTKLVALPFMGNPPSAATRNDFLPKGVEKAISILNQDPDGFALLVEGSQIDWAGHNNDSEFLKEELSDFEKTLKIILDFAEQDGNTLVVVTADHETGGLALVNGNIENGTNDTRWIHGSHTAVMVPIFSYGPGSNYFSGIKQNTDIYHIIMNLFGQTILEK